MLDIDVCGAAFKTVGDEAFWHRVNSGHWEPATFRAIARHLSPETTFLDFGTWIGPITLFAANRVKKVYSFEPDPEAARRLKANLALNPALAAKIEVIEKAVWPESGTIRLGAKSAAGDSMTSVHHVKAQTSWEIPTITPAEIEALLPPEGPVFLKIDTEGAEYDIVPQLTRLISRPGLTALVSFHPRFAAGGHPRFHKTFAMTQKVFAPFAGFKVHRVHHNTIRRAPLVEALTGMKAAWFEAKTSYLFTRD
ncbi:MAG: FkbM family methyltransferase [Proteobacteria bacterium]|nr:FkbM family methyltransferase [Pseudomonadota bacterium]